MRDNNPANSRSSFQQPRQATSEEALKAPNLFAAQPQRGDPRIVPLAASETYQQRLGNIEHRIAAVELVYQGSAQWEVRALKETLQKFNTYLEELRAITREKFLDRLNFISNPNALALEENGKFCRRIAQLQAHPTIASQLHEYIRETFWLNRLGYPVHSKVWDTQKQSNKAHDYMSARSSMQKMISDDQFRQVMLSEVLLDDQVRSIVSQIPLAEQQDYLSIAARRKENRSKLEEQNILGFGDCMLSHRSEFKFSSDQLLTQRQLDALAFAGRIEFGQEKLTILDKSCAAQWSSIEDLRSLLSTSHASAMRVYKAFERAGRIKGLHAVGQFFNNGMRELSGLDNAIFWNIAGTKVGDANYYGAHEIKRPLAQTTGAFVSLGDDVIVNADRPFGLLLYANGLISVNQFKELVLDWVTPSTQGNLDFRLPSFSWFLTNDFRIEGQTRA